MGMAPDDVVLTNWAKAVGDPVQAGDVVVIVETSKAELEITAEVSGVLGRHLFADGDTVAPGTIIGAVLQPGEQSGEQVGAPSGDAPVTAVVDGAVGSAPISPPPAPLTFDGGAGVGGPARPFPVTAVADGAHGPVGRATAADGESRPRHTVSPRARRLASEAARSGVVPAAPRTSAAPPPPPPPVRRLPRSTAEDSLQDTTSDAVLDARSDSGSPHDRYRAAISAAVLRSWRDIPHFAVTRELRVGPVREAVERWRIILPGLTLTDLLLRALALAMLERERRTEMAIGLAVATDRGVAIPVLRDVLGLGMVELVDARRAAVSRARDGRLHPDDSLVPATTLSNLGAIGVDQFTGVIPFGQTSMLTVGRAVDRPVVDDGALAVACTMQATLNADHRSWDGMHAGQALDRLARLLADPGPLLIPSTPGRQPSEEESA
nr:2-oxo acid dehydrogenase subunit E2 [Nakamurella flavida]